MLSANCQQLLPIQEQQRVRQAPRPRSFGVLCASSTTTFRPGLTLWAKINFAPPPPHFAQERRELGTPAAGLDLARSLYPANSERVLTHAFQPRGTPRNPPSRLGLLSRH